MRALKTLVWSWVCVAVVMVSGVALSQPVSTTAIQVEQFEPLPAPGLNILNVNTSAVLPHLTPSFAILLHYVDDPLVVQRANGDDTVVSRLIDDQLKPELSAALGFFDVLSLGIVVPMTATQSGEDLGVVDRPGEQVEGFAISDMRVIIKAQLVDPAQFSGFGVNLSIPMFIPIGDADQFGGDDSFRLRPVLGFDYRDEGGFLIAANVGYTLRPVRRALTHVSDDTINWGLGLEVPTPAKALTIVASLFGAIQTGENRDPFALADGVGEATAESDDPMELLGGLRVRFDDNWSMMAGAGAGLAGSVGAPLWRGFLGFGYTPAVADVDKDGVPDAEDQCKTEPEDLDGHQDSDGCPDTDNDVDGVLDADDGPIDESGYGICRDQPEDIDSFEDLDGCPDADNDGDKILDNDDKCPGDPEDMDGFQDDDGCPDEDNDADGILDLRDGPVAAGKKAGSCAGQPEDMDGFEDNDGCPDPDNDGDGILDVDDKCPNDPENKDGNEDDDGCPDGGTDNAKVSGKLIKIEGQVKFVGRTDRISSKSHSVLDEVAEVLKKNPHITKIHIAGHTDSAGSDAANMLLSEKRSASVKKYLVSKGIDGKRLNPVGYGEARPIADNASPIGRTKNHRVDFQIAEINGKPVK